MARLAAYYQEDFHYSPVPKQRKSAYIVYEEPKNNLFNNGYGGGSRIRSLGASDPSLSPACSPKTAVMTLKAKPRPLNYKLIEQSRLAMQRLENLYEPTDALNPYAIAKYDAEMLQDNESVYSQMYDDPYARHRHKSRESRTCKRLSYNGSLESHHDQYQQRSFDTGDSFPLCVDPHDQCLTPPVSFRSDCSHERWQQWPWNVPASPAMMSPSPHDSGLSSQSITSSPSLEAEPLSLQFQQPSRPDVHRVCSCSPVVYAEPGRVVSPPGRYDSGRGSPGAYSVTPRSKKSSRRRNDGMVFVDDDDAYARSQVRYGVLGILNEPVQHPHFVPPEGSGTYYYVEANAGPVKVPEPKSFKHHHQKHANVLIVEPQEDSKGSSSPDQDVSEKTEDPASSVSSPAPDPPSLASSADHEERRKSKKKTEKDIRELEDMYQKCNLGDRDLLERAERRDLPTQHQLRPRLSPPGLSRSKSDTLYEILSSTYHNPYEIPARAPPLRRSGIPDIIGDDMALRKHHKPSTCVHPVDNTMTYMLCSSHFTPTVPNGKDFMYVDCPDVEYDDLSYRKHYFGKKGRIPDPQPPFGIPLRPPPPQSVYSDYLHAVPNGGPPPLCHPRGHPDVVRDDMAYRTLRKDEQEAMYNDIKEVHRKRRGSNAGR